MWYILTGTEELTLSTLGNLDLEALALAHHRVTIWPTLEVASRGSRPGEPASGRRQTGGRPGRK